ncbi:uncharacterized protein TNCV_37031 [Trichonephila clavipes]|nr:uncharacterized protein TNCV_37031 [Trichonephila clavipes]
MMVHDGTPAHLCAPLHDWLDMAHSGHWIGRGGPVLWPPTIASFTPLDFFPWGNLKELEHRDIVSTQTYLVARLQAACYSVDTELLQRVHSSILRHAQAGRDLHSRHLEHLPL